MHRAKNIHSCLIQTGTTKSDFNYKLELKAAALNLTIANIRIRRLYDLLMMRKRAMHATLLIVTQDARRLISPGIRSNNSKPVHPALRGA